MVPFSIWADWRMLLTTLARGEDAVSRTLADLFSYQADYIQGHAEAAIVFASVTRNGKTNTDGHAEFLGNMRHRDPALCPVGALGQAFFMRWEVCQTTIFYLSWIIFCKFYVLLIF